MCVQNPKHTLHEHSISLPAVLKRAMFIHSV